MYFFPINNFVIVINLIKTVCFTPCLPFAEHKPPSSPSQTRTSLRAQLRSRNGPSKERLRVSFSESPSLDFSRGDRETGRKLDVLDLDRDPSPNRSNAMRNSRKNNQSELHNRDLKLESYDQMYVPCSANYRELLKKLHTERKAVDDLCNYTSWSANEFLNSTRSSCGQLLGQHLETDSNPSSSLKLSSGEDRVPSLFSYLDCCCRLNFSK